MKTYTVTLTKSFGAVEANNEEEVKQKVIDECAKYSETLMPHNMEMDVFAEDIMPKKATDGEWDKHN